MAGKADKKCCVEICGKKNTDNVVLHAFPNPDKDADRFRTWLYAIGGPILALDNKKIYKYRKVCDDHFEARYNYGHKRISPNAVPTLYLKGRAPVGSKDTLHKFPSPFKNKNMFNTWVYSVGGHILNLENDYIFKYRRVCHRHFEEKYFCYRNRLSNIAVPTKHLAGLSAAKFTSNESSVSRRTANIVSEATSKGSNKTLHGFPNPVTNSERFRTWVYAVGGDILKLKNEYIYKYRRVCHAHFEERFCCRFNKISNIATPTLHMPGYSILNEHNYYKQQGDNCDKDDLTDAELVIGRPGEDFHEHPSCSQQKTVAATEKDAAFGLAG